MGIRPWIIVFLLFAFGGNTDAKAKPKAVKLSEQLLSSDPKTRLRAIEDYNKMPSDAQYKLVPDFMVALSDPNPEVRKIASRILKAMGVKVEENLPDTQQLLEAEKSSATVPSPKETLKETQSEKQSVVTAEVQKSTISEPSRRQMYKEIQSEKKGAFDDLKKEMEAEKKAQVNLDPSEFKSQGGATGAFSPVVESLKDPDPWVRAQAARRLALIRPAPVETIPTLLKMLDDKEAESRGAAAAALGSMGPLAREAAPALNRILADPNPTVRQIASEALQQVQQIR